MGEWRGSENGREERVSHTASAFGLAKPRAGSGYNASVALFLRYCHCDHEKSFNFDYKSSPVFWEKPCRHISQQEIDSPTVYALQDTVMNYIANRLGKRTSLVTTACG